MNGDGLSGASGTGNEHVRRLAQIAKMGPAGDVLAQRDQQWFF